MKKILNLFLFPYGHSLLELSKLLVFINENFKVVIIQINIRKEGILLLMLHSYVNLIHESFSNTSLRFLTLSYFY